MLNDGQFRMQSPEAACGHYDLALAIVFFLKEYLAMQVGEIDNVIIDQSDCANPGGGEIDRGRAPRPPMPTMATRAPASFSCPSSPTSGSWTCRDQRRI